MGVARIFSGRLHFLDQKSDDLFSSSPSHPYTSYTAINPLSHLRGCISPNSDPFCLIPTKMSRKIFCHPGGAPAPPALPGYAYVSVSPSLPFISFLHSLAVKSTVRSLAGGTRKLNARPNRHYAQPSLARYIIDLRTAASQARHQTE